MWVLVFYFIDLLLYGFVIVVIAIFAKIFPWAAASVVLGFYPGTDLVLGIDFAKNVLIASAVMVGASVLAGVLSKRKFVSTKNVNASEGIILTKQEKYKDAAWQIVESFLCFLAAVLVSRAGEHFLPDHKFILFVMKSLLAYAMIQFRLKRNGTINESFYEAKRQEIRRQQETIRQQQLAEQEELRQAEEQRNRQLQIEAENAQRIQRDRERQFQRDRNVFADFIIRERRLPEDMRQVFNGRYNTYDLAKCAEENETWIFIFGELGLQISRKDVGAVWVTNDERISKIEKIIISSGLFDDVHLDSNKGDAPYLMALSESDDPLSFLPKPPHAFQTKRQSLAPLYSNIRVFTSRRRSEFNALIQFRAQYYLSEYRMIKAGVMGEKAVEEILDLHRGSFFVIHNLRLEFPNESGKTESVETDTFVMAPYGLFAIETKNYGASGKYRLVVTGDGNWYKEYPSRGPETPARRERMVNPFEQNDRHIAFLERFINELLGRDMMNYARVKNIIVVANDNVEIDSDPAAKQTLTRVGNLYNQLTQDTTPRFTLDELHRIEKALKERNLAPKKYPMNDYREELRGMVLAYRRLLMLSTEMGKAEKKLYSQNHKSLDSGFAPR